jgi:hypothetical protein
MHESEGKMKRNVRIMGAAALAVLMTGSHAGTTTSPASPVLLLVGHVDAVHSGAGTAVIIGQVVHISPTTQLSPLLLTGVFGTRESDGSIDASSVQTGVYYTPGDTEVLLTGVVVSANPSLGQIKIGDVTVDITNTPACVGGAMPKAGDVVQVMGIQPVAGGIVLAAKIQIGADQIALHPLMTQMPATANGNGGTGITGSGRQTN